jgi:hypothetical protein
MYSLVFLCLVYPGDSTLKLAWLCHRMIYKIWYCVQNIVLKPVFTKCFDGVKIWVYEGRITLFNICTIMKRGYKCDHSWLMAIWKGFRMQRLERTSMLLEAYLSLLPRSKDRSSAVVDKGSVKWARPGQASTRLSTCHRTLAIAPSPAALWHCASHITSVKRGMDVLAFTVVFRGVTKIYRSLI